MGKLKIGSITLGVCATNCYYLYREGTEKAVFIDPADRGSYLYDKVTAAGLSIEAILLTHGHFDHITGADELRSLSGAKIYALDKEQALLEDVELNVSADFGHPVTLKADVLVKDGEELAFGDIRCKVIATPGHTKGGCCYYFEEDGILISGDTIFQESVGRTDFPTGSMHTLVRSIKEKLFVLPEDTAVYPGHGGSTTIAHEKMYNPFFGEL